jgi:putative SOS response-associated peptidase YedK
MRWGLVPSWAKDISMGVKLINARAESLAEKPAFRDAFRARRCLVPTNGFYEWNKNQLTAAGKKQPYHFGMADDSVFALAGLWERWKQPAGDWLLSFTIITTTANQLMQEVHDRMPAIIAPEAYDRWLDPGFGNAGDLMELLQPYPASRMRRYAVSTRVGSVKNDDPECADPVSSV